MRLFLLLTLLFIGGNYAFAQNLKVIDQDYQEALNVAAQDEKLIFIDFYTTWCKPCKELDKLVFENDSMRQVLGEAFVLLKYNAESDTVFHLSKKHHVRSYPTAVILNASGKVVTRKYGFPGDDFHALSKSVLEFTKEGLELSRSNTMLSGYSSMIDATAYPSFYTDYVNRTNTKIDSVEFAEYWKAEHDVFSEGYFSTICYFSGMKVPDAAADDFLKNKQKYTQLYGDTDVGVTLMFLSFDKFEVAIATKSPSGFDGAKKYVKMAVNADFAEQIISRYQADFDEIDKE